MSLPAASSPPGASIPAASPPSASPPAADPPGSGPGALSGGSRQERDVIASLQIVGAALDKARAAESRREAEAAYLASLPTGRDLPDRQYLADALVALGLPVPRHIDKDLKEALLALATINERLERFGAGPREKSDRENGSAAPAPTGPVQGRPGSGNAGTAPAPKGPHAKAPKGPHAKAPRGPRAKRRRRKARNNAQQQAEQTELGATTPGDAPAGPEEPPTRNTRNDRGEAPAASEQAPAAGSASHETTRANAHADAPAANIQAPAAGSETSNTTPAPSEADRADESAGPRACRGCSEQLRVPVGLRQRNIRKGWVPHKWCRSCKLANDAHYARENTAQATPVASNPEFRTASPAAPATSDGETSPANAVAPATSELRAASPATPVTSGVKPPEMNWLQAAKGSLRQAEH